MRFGHFEHFFHRGQKDELRQLADYVIGEYFPEFAGDYTGWFGEIVKRTAEMIAGWQAVGFVIHDQDPGRSHRQAVDAAGDGRRSARGIERAGDVDLGPAAGAEDGGKIAMILSKDGWTDLYVCNADGSNLRRLTKSPQDESSPCWSPDGKWICFAAKEKEHRSLCKVSPSDGPIQHIATGGVPSPSEPDWSPDGK